MTPLLASIAVVVFIAPFYALFRILTYLASEEPLTIKAVREITDEMRKNQRETDVCEQCGEEFYTFNRRWQYICKSIESCKAHQVGETQ